VWVYRGADWYIPDPEGPHVACEAWTVKFQPKVMSHIGDITDNVAKLVGVSDDQGTPPPAPAPAPAPPTVPAAPAPAAVDQGANGAPTTGRD
jgi:hypothetical protein